MSTMDSLKPLLGDINKKLEILNKKEQKMYSQMFETPLREEKNAEESKVIASNSKVQKEENQNKDESSGEWDHRYVLTPLIF